MVNLHCECHELKPKGETNISVLVLHPSSGVHTVKTVGSHLKENHYLCGLDFCLAFPEHSISNLFSIREW